MVREMSTSLRAGFVCVVVMAALSCSRAVSVVQTCPDLPTQPNSPSLSFAGFRLFIDPALDPEISEWPTPSRAHSARAPLPLLAGAGVPIAATLVNEEGPLAPFGSRTTVELLPAIPSTFTDLPLHVTANEKVRRNRRGGGGGVC